MSDLFELNAQFLQIAEEKFTAFKESFQDVPGVMDISEDIMFGDAYFVAIDSKNYIAESVPHIYEGITIQFTNVYETLESFKGTQERIKDCNDESILKIIRSNIDHLQSIVEKYEKKL